MASAAEFKSEAKDDERGETKGHDAYEKQSRPVVTETVGREVERDGDPTCQPLDDHGEVLRHLKAVDRR